MKKPILKAISLILFLVVWVPIAWGDGSGSDNNNPFYPDKTYQGYSLLRVVFPDGNDEYYSYPIWGVNPRDGVGTLYYKRPGGTQYISDKLNAFLRDNDVEYDGGSEQFNIWPVYTYHNFPFILTTGMEGDGSFEVKSPYPNGALNLSSSDIKNNWNRHTWLINPNETIPQAGIDRAPGWATTFTFIPPDLQATSVESGAPPGGAMPGNTYKASAQFYMNYKMVGWSTVRLYQFKNHNTAVLLKEQLAFFGRFGGVNLNGVSWTMDDSTTSIVASVGMRYDNNTRSWVQEGYSNSYVALAGNNADIDWSNNIKQITIASGSGSVPNPPPQIPEQSKNLSVTDLKLLNADGNSSPSTIEVNKPYKIKAAFKSNFNTSGWAVIRLYIKRENGSTELRKDTNVFFEPNSSIERTFDWTGMTEKVTFIATIAYRWQSDKFVEELFNGEKETTYEDNKRELTADLSITKPPYQGPESYEESNSVWFPPLVWKEIKVVEVIHEDIPGWKEIRFIKDDSRDVIRTLLIPSSGREEESNVYR